MNSKVKVIKKADVPSRNTKKVKQVSARETAREAVNTVTNWVSDFQARKRQETRNAFEQLITKPQPSES